MFLEWIESEFWEEMYEIRLNLLTPSISESYIKRKI